MDYCITLDVRLEDSETVYMARNESLTTERKGHEMRDEWTKAVERETTEVERETTEVGAYVAGCRLARERGLEGSDVAIYGLAAVDAWRELEQ